MSKLDRFLLGRYDEMEIIARSCARAHEDEIRWQWVDIRSGESIASDPFDSDLLNRGKKVRLQTVEQHVIKRGQLSSSVLINTADDVDSTVALHILMHDPAAVIRDVEAKRSVVKELVERVPKRSILEKSASWPILLMLVQPFKYHMLFDQEWDLSKQPVLESVSG